MAQNCLACFAAFTAPATAGDRFAGQLYCTRNAPAAQSTNPDAWLWPLVEEDWTCREGADAITGLSYGSIVNGTPGANGAGYTATSTTSLTIASSGSLAATTQTGLAYTAGARVRLSSRGAAAWMEGLVTAYSGAGALTFTADLASGSGTHTDWDINLAGNPGLNGSGIVSSGSITLTTSPLVVSDTNVTANSNKVILWPTNNAAGLLMAGIGGTGTPGAPYVSAVSSGVGFTVTTSASGGGGPGGTETFFYIVTA